MNTHESTHRFSGLSMLAAVSVANCARFYVLVARGTVRTSFPVPFSALVCLAFLLPLVAILRGQPGPAGLKGLALAAVTVAVCMAAFPLAQMVCFGKTDYRRPADAIVVFGARVYNDGRPSDALADRTRTGCRLYLDGLAGQVVFSGGRNRSGTRI